MFSFEDGPDIEFGDTPHTGDNDSAVSEEGRLLLPGFITESTNLLGYSLSFRSCLIFLISLLKSFRSWHMTFALLTKLWTTPHFT
jgi:hypothetical protein